MGISFSNFGGASSSTGTGFNLDVGSSGNNTFVFSEAQPAGGYSVTSQLTDATLEFYAIAPDGTLAGYTNTKALAASKAFDKIVIYGAINNDLITFEYKPTTLPTSIGQENSGAAPFVSSISDADLANIDDTTIITGGNFATDVVVTFTGTDNVVRNAKSIVRTNSTQLIVTRPDEFLEDNSPYTLEVSNPGIPQSSYITHTSAVTPGGDPVWSTNAGSLSSGVLIEPYSETIQATDPDGSSVTYFLASGSLPSGLSLNSTTGEISGTPDTVEISDFTISVSDESGNITNRSFQIKIVQNITGGDVTESGGYVYHTFASNGTFETVGNVTVDALIVAGGGGGGGSYRDGSGGVAGGGAGAGGYIEKTSFTVNPGSYAITVGAGGSGGGRANSGLLGNNTEALGLTALGGGYGGGRRLSPQSPGTGTSNGGNGGSGGSASGDTGSLGSAQQPGSASGGFGSNGFGSVGGTRSSSGGGGAGAAGTTHSNPNGSPGGAGKQWLNGLFYAGGGGGGGTTADGSGVGGAGGSGVGGVGGNANSSTTGDGQENRGGGGGGAGGGNGGEANGGSGGSGIVVIRYPA